MDPCIICTESTPEGLKKNNLCPCKYYIHNACWVDYVHSTQKVRCLMCRKYVNFQPKPSAPPAPSQINTTMHNIQPYEGISYQEFYTTVSHSQISVPGEQPIRVIVTTSDGANNRNETSDKVFCKNKLSAIIIGMVLIVGIMIMLMLLI